MKRLLVLSVFFFSLTLLAQGTFEAKASRTSIGIDERVKVDYFMTFDGDNFEEPNFESSGFRVVSGPNVMVSQQWVNGKGMFNKIYTFILSPLKKGNLVIKPATIEFNGRHYKTNSLKIVVGDAVQENDPYNQKQYRPQPIPNGGVFLEADISNTNPYLNEPVTVLYKLYVNTEMAITDWKDLGKPKYENFWSQSESIDGEDIVVKNAVYKGQNYLVAVLRKTVLYPQKTGQLVVEPLRLSVDVETVTGRDFFGNLETTIQRRKVSSGSSIINVKPIPTYPNAAEYDGAVGDFELDVTPSTRILEDGQSLKLTVTVTGKGNLKLFSLPKPSVPDEFELFDPVHTETVDSGMGGMSGMTGSVTDTYTLVPLKRGNFTLQPLRFTYFDLGSKSFKTKVSEPIEIKVLYNPNKSQIAAAKAQQTQNKQSAKTFAYIRQKTQLQNKERNGFLGSGLFYTLLTLPFLAIPLLLVVRKRKEEKAADVTGNRIRQSSLLAKKYLTEAQKHLNQKEPFYVALEKALHNFLKAKLHIETTEMSKDRVKELLRQKNAGEQSIAEFMALIENCEIARYAPAGVEAIQTDYQKAVEVLAVLEKELS